MTVRRQEALDYYAVLQRRSDASTIVDLSIIAAVDAQERARAAHP